MVRRLAEVNRLDKDGDTAAVSESVLRLLTARDAMPKKHTAKNFLADGVIRYVTILEGGLGMRFWGDRFFWKELFII